MCISTPTSTIFYQNCPHIWGKLTSFVIVLAQNTCLCVVIDQYYIIPKFNISALERFTKPGMGIMDKFLLQIYHLLPSQSPFWRKTDKFVAVLAQNTRVYGCRLVLYHLNFNIGLWERFMKPGKRIKDRFPVQPYHILPSQPIFWRIIGMMGVVSKIASQEHRTKAKTLFCF